MITLKRAYQEVRPEDRKRKRAILVIGSRAIHMDRWEVEKLLKDIVRYLGQTRKGRSTRRAYDDYVDYYSE